MLPVILMMKMCQVVIRQCEGYTQHKPEVVDYRYNEPFRDFLHQIMKVYAPKSKLWRNYNYRDLKVLLTLGLHAVFIEFCKIYGYFLQGVYSL